MANYNSLKATVNANVKANNNQEITGPVLNSVLMQIIDTIGAGYLYMGIATPSDPGSDQTPDYKCFYIAGTPGIYSHLGAIEVSEGEIAILKWGASWTKENTGIASAAVVEKLRLDVDGIMASIAPFADYYCYFNNIGEYVDRWSGEFVTGQGNDIRRTDYIDLSNYAKIIFSVGGDYTMATVAFFDANKNYLSGLSVIGGSYEETEIDLASSSYANAKYVIVSSWGFLSHSSEISATLIARESWSQTEEQVRETETRVTAIEEFRDSLSYLDGVGLGLPVSVLEKFLFLGISPVDAPYQTAIFTLDNLVGDGYVESIRSGVGVRYLQSGGVAIDSELYFSKAVFIDTVCGYDFSRVFALYDDTETPHHLKMLGVARPGAEFSETEWDAIKNVFKLNTFRNGSLSLSGIIKNDFPMGARIYANLVNNPAFESDTAWTHGQVWTISGGMARCSDTQETQSSLSQTVELTVGKRYRVGFKLYGITSGAIQFRANWNEFVSDPLSVNTAFEFEFTVTGNGSHQDEIMFRPADGDGFVGNIELVELVELD